MQQNLGLLQDTEEKGDREKNSEKEMWTAGIKNS